MARHPSGIRHVDNDEYGCFVACVAMLYGLTYQEAFCMVHPRRFQNSRLGGRITPDKAFQKLIEFGLEPRVIQIGTIWDLDQTALIWLRWTPRSGLMHSVIYEHKRARFWDPNYDRPLVPHQIRNLDFLKEQVIVLDGYHPAEDLMTKSIYNFYYNDSDVYWI